MQVVDVEDYWRGTFTIPGLDHKALVFYGPPMPKSGQPMFTVTAWTSIGLEEYCEVVPAKRLSDDVEDLVGQAKERLVDQVLTRLGPTT